MQFTNGVITPILKALGETEDDMQTVTLSKKQFITKLIKKRIDKNTREYTFIDKNDNC